MGNTVRDNFVSNAHSVNRFLICKTEIDFDEGEACNVNSRRYLSTSLEASALKDT